MLPAIADRIPWPAFAVAAIAGALALLALSSLLLPPLGFVLLGGVVYSLFALRRPTEAMTLALFFVPFESMALLFPPSAKGQMTFLSTLTIPKMMLLAIFATYFVRITVLRDGRLLRSLSLTPVPLLAVAFVLYTFLSVYNATNMAFLLGQEARFVNSLLLMLLLINLVETKPELYRILAVLTASYFFVSLIGLWEAVTQQHILDLMGIPQNETLYATEASRFRVTGPSGDPDAFAFSLVLGALSTLATFRITRNRWVRLILALMLPIFVLDMVGTGSRAGALWLLAAFGIFWFFVEMRHKSAIGISAVLLIAVVFTLYTLFVSGLAADRYTGESGQKSLLYRIGWMRMCLAMILDHPILGVGTANFLSAYNRYLDPLVPRTPFVAHNSYAQLTAENGIPALLLYLSVFFFAGLALFTCMRRTRDSRFRHVVLCLFCVLCAYALFSGTASTISSELNWLMFAFAVVAWKLYSTEIAATDASLSDPRGSPRT